MEHFALEEVFKSSAQSDWKYPHFMNLQINIDGRQG